LDRASPSPPLPLVVWALRLAPGTLVITLLVLAARLSTLTPLAGRSPPRSLPRTFSPSMLPRRLPSMLDRPLLCFWSSVRIRRSLQSARPSLPRPRDDRPHTLRTTGPLATARPQQPQPPLPITPTTQQEHLAQW